MNWLQQVRSTGIMYVLSAFWYALFTCSDILCWLWHCYTIYIDKNKNAKKCTKQTDWLTNCVVERWINSYNQWYTWMLPKMRINNNNNNNNNPICKAPECQKTSVAQCKYLCEHCRYEDQCCPVGLWGLGKVNFSVTRKQHTNFTYCSNYNLVNFIKYL